MENYGEYIVFISKYHCRAEECLSRCEIDELSSTPPIDKLYTQIGNVNRLHNINEPFAALF